MFQFISRARLAISEVIEETIYRQNHSRAKSQGIIKLTKKPNYISKLMKQEKKSLNRELVPKSTVQVETRTLYTESKKPRNSWEVDSPKFFRNFTGVYGNLKDVHKLQRKKVPLPKNHNYPNGKKEIKRTVKTALKTSCSQKVFSKLKHVYSKMDEFL